MIWNIVSQGSLDLCRSQSQPLPGPMRSGKMLKNERRCFREKHLWDFLSTERVKEAKPVVLTGHSLPVEIWRSCMPAIAGRGTTRRQGQINIEVITFAAPAPGNSAFAEDFDENFPVRSASKTNTISCPNFPAATGWPTWLELYSA